MKKGSAVLLIGIILVIAAIVLYAFLASNVGMQAFELPGSSEKEINYNLTMDNYTLIIQTTGKIHYILYNSTSILSEGNVTDHIVKELGTLKGSYTLKIENLENSTATIAVSLKSKSSLMSLGIQVLSSGGVCIIGIIMIIVGIWFIIREKRKHGEEDVFRSYKSQ